MREKEALALVLAALCLLTMTGCAETMPELREVGQTQKVRCFRADEIG